MQRGSTFMCIALFYYTTDDDLDNNSAEKIYHSSR